MKPNLFISSLTFSDGTTVDTSDASVIVIVGPNNSGKSSTLREIQAGAGPKGNFGPVLRAATFEKEGSLQDLKDWLDQNVLKVRSRYEDQFVYAWLGGECKEDSIEPGWKSPKLGALNEILCNLIDVEKRLEVANEQEPIDFYSQAPKHPFHILFKNPALEEKVSAAFRSAFRADLVLNRGGGKVIAFHFGDKPTLSLGEDVLSPEYFAKLMRMPFLHKQGHGMRSFVGSILHAFTSPAFISLLDEPEAFLHPPHAKLLGGLLGRSIAKDRQLVIATHSGDFLRGILDANPSRLRVIRLIRDGTVNHAHELDSRSIQTLWADPILRFSNVLDGIFHDGVVLCESDSDCRFYSAILAALQIKRDEIPPDVMFAASGGKDRMPVIVRALNSLGLKMRVIADFDVLRDEGTLNAIVQALGGNWKNIEPAWRKFKTSLESQSPPLSTNQVREQILSVLDKEGASVSEKAIDGVKQVLKATSSWHVAKLAGISAVPSGEPRIQIDNLLRQLQECGLYVVKCGEIERFVPSIGAHGPKWLAQALTRDLASDQELDAARNFVDEVFGIGPHSGWSRAQAITSREDVTRNPPPTRSLWKSLIKILGF